MSFVGREYELNRIIEAIEIACSRGGTLLLSGEAGLGKTRLLSEVRREAHARGMCILDGACYRETVEPFLPFSSAIGSSLFEDQEHVSFKQVLVINDSGLLLASASQQGEGNLDTDIFAGMLTAVQNFIGDSFANKEGTLGRLEYGDLKIITERMNNAAIVAIFDGNEHPDMPKVIKKAAREIDNEHGETIRAWRGDAASAAPVQKKAEAVTNARFLVRKNLDGLKLEVERLRICETIIDRLRNLSLDKPMVLLLEDMHWADESSLFALEYLVRNIDRERIALIASFRPEESSKLAETLKRIRSENNITDVELSMLKAGSVRALVDSQYSPNDFKQDFIEKLAKDCNGNPFFLTELLNHMSNEAIITKKDGIYHVHDTLVSVPSSISELVRRRLDSMGPEEMAMAEYLSCIGKKFNARSANSLTSVRDAQNALDFLLEKGIIMLTGEGAGQLEFTHTLFQDVIYNEISPRWRTAHHRTLGEYYEAEYSDSISDVAYELARHFSRTNERAKALEYCMKAGEKAEAGFAAEQARAFYGDALKACISNPEKQAILHDRMGDLCFILSDCKKAVEHYTAAMGLSNEPEQRADMLRKIADSYEKLSEYDTAKAEAVKGLELLSNRDSPVEARLLMSIGRVQMRQGDYPLAIENLAKAANAAEKLGELRDLGMAEHLLGSVYLHKGDYKEAKENFEKAAAIRESIGDISGLAASMNNIGNVHARTGEWEKALEHYKASSETDAKVGDKLGLASALSNVASVYLNMSKPDDAMPILEESIKIAREIGDKRGLAISLINYNLAHYLKQDYPKAISILTEALEICEANGLKYECIFCYNGLCEMYSHLGKAAEGLELTKRSLALSKEMDTKDGEAMSRMFMGAAQRDLGEMDAARENLELSLKIMEDIKHNQLNDLHLEYALYWKKAGDAEAARPHLEKALEGYEKNGNSSNADRCRKEIEELKRG